MNYSQTLEFLDSAMPSYQNKGAEAYNAGLDRIAEICRLTGNPQRNYFTIHVAGTDGKGSVSSMIAAVLMSAGYRTGLYTSPHLHEFRERIRVDGEMIPKQKVVNFVDKYRDAMVAAGLSFFEMTTAMAFDYFDQSDVEVAVIETGLGGRLDATNIITPIVSVITNIGLEHTDVLGPTLADIAAEKAGIFKKSIPVVIGELSEACREVFENRAAELKSKIVYAEKEFALESREACGNGNRFGLRRHRDGYLFDLFVDLAGDCQCRNIVTACTVLDFLHEETPLTISRRALIEGLRSAAADTGLRGRWQRVSEAPLTVCDTGHTSCAFEYTVRQLEASPCTGPIVAVLGFVSDKRADRILEKLGSLSRPLEIVFTRPGIERGMPLERVREYAEAVNLKCPYTFAGTVAEAVELARTKAGEQGMVFVGGSTFVVSEVLAND